MMTWNPIAWWLPLLDAMPDWDPDPPEPGEVEESEPEAPACPVVDVEDKAASVTYANGKRKRDRFPLVDLSRRKVVIAGHQCGVERSEARWAQTAHRVTCHRFISPGGTRYKVHPIRRRLVCTNRFDRAPWHAIGIECAGNHEGIDGSGKYYKPEIFGRSRASDAMLDAIDQECEAICEEVGQLGGEVVAIVPHRVAGVASNGRPNRPICPGSRLWGHGFERAAARLGLAVPGPDFTLGGLPIPDEWRGPFWPQITRTL